MVRADNPARRFAMAVTSSATSRSPFTAAPVGRLRATWRQLVATRSLFLMFLPGLLLLVVFEYGPMYGLLIAFKDYRLTEGVWASPWVGLAHFQELFGDDVAVNVLKNTLIISILKLLWGLPAPIILALLINEARAGLFKRFVQSVSYLPHFISWVILGSLVYSLLSPSTGMVNLVLKAIGIEPVYFMTEEGWFRPILVASSIWKEVGWGTIIYLAALAGISIELYEAAVIDGASRLQRMRDISLPSIMPVVGIVTVLSLGGILNAGFDQVFNLYNPRVYEVGDIIDTYVYRLGLIDFQYSFTTAVGFFKSVVGFILILIANFIARKVSDGRYGLW
ncbi:MAG: ABC transporter permease [Thermomicrobiales bacterium]